MYIGNSVRLSYRLLTPNDAQLLWELDQDPEVLKHINGGQVHSLEEIEQIYIPRLKKFTNPAQGWGMWGVFSLDTQDFLGWILVRPMEFFSEQPIWDELEIGWRFQRKYWGKGYASEAAQHILIAVKQLGLANSISATALADNTASIAIMKKLGLSYVKHYQHSDSKIEAEAVYYRLSWQ